MKRLEAYSKNLVDYRLITDLLPTISQMFFLNKLSKSLRLSFAQAAILIGLGLQYKHIDIVSAELKLPASQALALFNKAMRKFTMYFKRIYEKDVERKMKRASPLVIKQFKKNIIMKLGCGDEPIEGITR